MYEGDAKAPVERDLKVEEEDVVRERKGEQAELLYKITMKRFREDAKVGRFDGTQACDWWACQLNQSMFYDAVHAWPPLLDQLFEELHWVYCADERSAYNIDQLHQLCDQRFVVMSMAIIEKDPTTREKFADSQWVASLTRRLDRDTPSQFFARQVIPDLFCELMTKSKIIGVFCLRFAKYAKEHEDEPIKFKFGLRLASSGAFDSDETMGAEMAVFAFKHSPHCLEAQEAIEVMTPRMIMLALAQPEVVDIVCDANNRSVRLRSFYFHIITRAATNLHEQAGELFSFDGHVLNVDLIFPAEAVEEMLLSGELADQALGRVVKGICTWIGPVCRLYDGATAVAEAVIGLVKCSQDHSLSTRKIIVREGLRIIKQVDDVDLLCLDCKTAAAIGASAGLFWIDETPDAVVAEGFMSLYAKLSGIPKYGDVLEALKAGWWSARQSISSGDKV
jgi:hypothetical protein